MEIKYQNYWASVKKLQTEAQLIGRLDLSNKTKYKKKYETGEMTAEDIARVNHRNGLHYELTIFKENRLFCYLVLKGGHIRVNFIDGAQRVYLSYFFSPSEIYADKIFLEDIWYYHFSTEDSLDGEEPRHFGFKEAVLYENYPEFGQYEELIRLERDFPADIIPTNTNSSHTTDLPDHWSSSDWNKK